MKKRLVICLEGGGMSGVFGGGVLATFQELNLYPHIEAIYASSAGAVNASYFLTQQVSLGSSIYFEALTKGFLSRKNFLLGLGRYFSRHFISPRKGSPVINTMDVDYLIEVIQKRKVLDIDKLKQQAIPFYVNVLNLSSGETEYLLMQENNPWKLLRAAICMAPYTFEKTKIRGQNYLDGTIKEPIGLDYLRKKYPGHKIVIVSNRRAAINWCHYLKGFLEGRVADWMYGPSLAHLYMARVSKMKRDLAQAEKDPKILLIKIPSKDSTRPRTTNRKTLERTYQLGKEEGRGILDFLAS